MKADRFVSIADCLVSVAEWLVPKADWLVSVAEWLVPKAYRLPSQRCVHLPSFAFCLIRVERDLSVGIVANGFSEHFCFVRVYVYV